MHGDAIMIITMYQLIHCGSHAEEAPDMRLCCAAFQCELGATATSWSGGDLTNAIVACPPASCLGTNCPGKPCFDPD